MLPYTDLEGEGGPRTEVWRERREAPVQRFEREGRLPYTDLRGERGSRAQIWRVGRDAPVQRFGGRGGQVFVCAHGSAKPWPGVRAHDLGQHM
jgi:hypothetical protein